MNVIKTKLSEYAQTKHLIYKKEEKLQYSCILFICSDLNHPPKYFTPTLFLHTISLEKCPELCEERHFLAIEQERNKCVCIFDVLLEYNVNIHNQFWIDLSIYKSGKLLCSTYLYNEHMA